MPQNQTRKPVFRVLCRKAIRATNAAGVPPAKARPCSSRSGARVPPVPATRLSQPYTASVAALTPARYNASGGQDVASASPPAAMPPIAAAAAP